MGTSSGRLPAYGCSKSLRRCIAFRLPSLGLTLGLALRRAWSRAPFFLSRSLSCSAVQISGPRSRSRSAHVIVTNGFIRAMRSLNAASSCGVGVWRSRSRADLDLGLRGEDDEEDAVGLYVCSRISRLWAVGFLSFLRVLVMGAGS